MGEIMKEISTNREIIMAAMAGKTVQINILNEWNDVCYVPIIHLSTLDEPTSIYRIKPE